MIPQLSLSLIATYCPLPFKMATQFLLGLLLSFCWLCHVGSSRPIAHRFNCLISFGVTALYETRHLIPVSLSALFLIVSWMVPIKMIVPFPAFCWTPSPISLVGPWEFYSRPQLPFHLISQICLPTPVRFTARFLLVLLPCPLKSTPHRISCRKIISFPSETCYLISICPTTTCL